MSNACDLHVHSGFSIYDGLGLPKLVVERAQELGWGAVCLTEHGHMMSAPVLYQEAKKAGIKPITGCEMYVCPEDFLVDNNKEVLQHTRHLTVIALSREGYHNLVAWQNVSMERPNYYNKNRISIGKMIESAPFPLHHNVVLSGCIGSELCQAPEAGEQYVESMKSVFPNFYIELMWHADPQFLAEGHTAYDDLCLRQAHLANALIAIARETDTPMVLTNDSHYQRETQRKAHLAQLAAKWHRRESSTSQEGSAGKTAQGFAAEYMQWTAYMQSMEALVDRSFASQELLDNIHAIVNEADIRLDPLDSFSYAIPRSGYLDRLSEIRSRCKARLKSLAHRHGQAAYDRFEHEMSALGEFSDYLLLMADFLAMCRAQGILTWTRGSAANSLVCYCLRIHDIDPIRYKLLFERFVNPARKKLPDVDIDVQSDRVDDVRRLIREHMEGLEGKGNTLPICTYGTLANRSAFRTMAEAQGFSKDRIDELAALLPQMIDSGMVKDESEAYALLKEEDPALYELASAVFDAPSGVGQHACGIAFGTRERPLDLWVPNYRIGSSDAVVTQYNMAAIEALGLTKQDWLKLDTLRIMAGTLRLAGRDDRYLRDIPLDDSATFVLLRSGKTEGIHTFQGSVQREGCIEVKPESIDDLVAVQALYRPSGTRTGFTKTFCNRRFGREKWIPSRNPIVAEVLSETYGLPIYQEQIMEIGAKMGMTGTEIDDLYKAIKTAKGIGRGAAELFEQFKPVFMRYALKYADNEAAEDDWRLFDAFQGYGFNRGHATAYALLGYRSAYLKTHHQREFYISILEAYPDNPTYITAALRDGYKFEPPDINGSSGGFSPGRTQKSIRVGLLRVRDVGVGAVAEIVRGQPFRSLEDLRERTQAKSVDRTVVANLAAVGALESIGIKGEEDDATHFRLLNFCLNKPKVFEGIEPALGRRYNGGSWRFRGLLRGVERYTDKSFCAKLFWIPPGAEIHRKAAAMGGYYAWLLTVVDENGLPFDLIASDKKMPENETLQLLAAKNEDPGVVICAEGQCKQPFLPKRATGFQFWAISGAEDKNPQMWNCDEEVANMVMYLAEQKRFARSAA